jgi:hypothetical protein
MTIVNKLLVAVAVLFGVLLGFTYVALQHQRAATADAALESAHAAATAATLRVDTVTVRLAARIDTVKRIIHDTVSVPARALKPVTKADTIEAVRQLPIVTEKYAACRQQLSLLVDDCTEYKLGAQAKFRADSDVVRKMQVVIDHPPPMRRWSISLSGGYGAVAARDSTNALRVYTGPAVCLCVSFRIF